MPAHGSDPSLCKTRLGLTPRSGTMGHDLGVHLSVSYPFAAMTSGLHQLAYGDLATWLGSIGVVGTLYLALVQIRAEQRHRRADQHAAQQRERHQQAERISGWPGKESTDITPLILLNRSDEPVYEVVATLVFVQGGGARRGEDYGSSNYRRASVMSVLPPGRWRVDVGGGWHGMNRRPGVEVAFTDRAGITWIRRATGALEEVEMSPIDHYGLGRPQSLVIPISDEASPPAPPGGSPVPPAPTRIRTWRSRLRRR